MVYNLQSLYRLPPLLQAELPLLQGEGQQVQLHQRHREHRQTRCHFLFRVPLLLHQPFLLPLLFLEVFVFLPVFLGFTTISRSALILDNKASALFSPLMSSGF